VSSVRFFTPSFHFASCKHPRMGCAVSNDVLASQPKDHPAVKNPQACAHGDAINPLQPPTHPSTPIDVITRPPPIDTRGVSQGTMPPGSSRTESAHSQQRDESSASPNPRMGDRGWSGGPVPGQPDGFDRPMISMDTSAELMQDSIGTMAYKSSVTRRRMDPGSSGTSAVRARSRKDRTRDPARLESDDEPALVSPTSRGPGGSSDRRPSRHQSLRRHGSSVQVSSTDGAAIVMFPEDPLTSACGRMSIQTAPGTALNPTLPPPATSAGRNSPTAKGPGASSTSRRPPRHSGSPRTSLTTRRMPGSSTSSRRGQKLFPDDDFFDRIAPQLSPAPFARKPAEGDTASPSRMDQPDLARFDLYDHSGHRNYASSPPVSVRGGDFSLNGQTPTNRGPHAPRAFPVVPALQPFEHFFVPKTVSNATPHPVRDRSGVTVASHLRVAPQVMRVAQWLDEAVEYLPPSAVHTLRIGGQKYPRPSGLLSPSTSRPPPSHPFPSSASTFGQSPSILNHLPRPPPQHAPRDVSSATNTALPSPWLNETSPRGPIHELSDRQHDTSAISECTSPSPFQGSGNYAVVVEPVILLFVVPGQHLTVVGRNEASRKVAASEFNSFLRQAIVPLPLSVVADGKRTLNRTSSAAAAFPSHDPEFAVYRYMPSSGGGSKTGPASPPALLPPSCGISDPEKGLLPSGAVARWPPQLDSEGAFVPSVCASVAPSTTATASQPRAIVLHPHPPVAANHQARRATPSSFNMDLRAEPSTSDSMVGELENPLMRDSEVDGSGRLPSVPSVAVMASPPFGFPD
jgi:hypothetical protein